MDALKEDGDHVCLDSGRCIGCGLCVTICPSEALNLVRKSESGITLVPDTINDTWRDIQLAQNK
jgi:Fe-S-cluster-containing hydrogenase component 2